MKVDPARAGMILNISNKHFSTQCGPRASGDDPARFFEFRKQAVWTPRERG